MWRPTGGLAFVKAITARALFGATVCYFMLLTLVGRCRPLKAVLSARVWVPIARLSYSMYLLQFIASNWVAKGINVNDYSDAKEAGRNSFVGNNIWCALCDRPLALRRKLRPS